MTQIMTRVASGTSVRVAIPLCHSGIAIGTPIMTTEGALPVEYLTEGDRIITYDAGAVCLDRVMVRKTPRQSLVRIRPSVLDEAGYGRDIVMSARQRILVKGWRAKVLFGKQAALVEARKLADGDYIEQLEGAVPTRLFQLHFADSQHLVQIGQGMTITSAKIVKTKA